MLCLNHNHIESVVAKQKAGQSGSGARLAKPNIDPSTRVLENLEVLHLA